MNSSAPTQPPHITTPAPAFIPESIPISAPAINLTTPSSYSKEYKLTTKNLFNHFLLIHDFLHRFTKTESLNPQYLNTQLDVKDWMVRATENGGRFGQIGAFSIVAAICLKSNRISLKFISGFLYIYWINHIYTLGSYCGAIAKMPKAYARMGEYYKSPSNKEAHPNLMDRIELVMEKENDYEDTQEILNRIFPTNQLNTQDSYITNDYFFKNREKYIPKEQLQKKNLKLTYFDSFLTRYVYYSFSRWFWRVKLFLGVEQE